MADGQKSVDVSMRRRWIWTVAIVLPLAVAAVLFTAFTVTVQADVPLAPPPSTLPPVASPEMVVLHAPTVHLEFASPIAQLRGIASWYGAPFDGHTTANGERFDMHALTACTNALPFDSVVRVVNMRNRRSVVVRINDRGLLFPGRVIDLSYAAAQQLNMTHSGVAPVRLDVLWMGKKRAAK
ncbi:MAG TPA: septal ring lytic transglycosylase RlpA family protein [Terracidiphilus sp.]